MNSKIKLTLLATLLFYLNASSQNVKDFIKRGSTTVNILKNTIDKAESNFQILTYKDADQEFKVTVFTDESYCGLSQKKTKRYRLDLTSNNQDKKQGVFSFVDGTDCVTEASEQWKNNKDVWSDKSLGTWEVGFLTDPENKSVIFCNIFSEKLLTQIYPDPKEASKIIPFRRYTLKGDSVYLFTAKTTDELSKNSNDIGHFYMKFSEGKIINNENNEICKYEGSNKYLLMKMYFALEFRLKDTKVASLLKDAAKNKSQENKIANQNVYLQKSKHCQYCNKEYKGVSFDFDLWRSREKPCSDKIIEVYRDGFCSRKCALDHCNSTR